jgi:prepilin-type processing-associated H-X9-DG protein
MPFKSRAAQAARQHVDTIYNPTDVMLRMDFSQGYADEEYGNFVSQPVSRVQIWGSSYKPASSYFYGPTGAEYDAPSYVVITFADGHVKKYDNRKNPIVQRVVTVDGTRDVVGADASPVALSAAPAAPATPVAPTAPAAVTKAAAAEEPWSTRNYTFFGFTSTGGNWAEKAGIVLVGAGLYHLLMNRRSED